uniref:Uncharacterized protein n=1 Tax=Latimeria chalumnae TaxID=7897 RepID=H3A0D9_LATCH
FSDILNDDGDLEDWKPPDPDLVQKMVLQVEYYLSDENLAKDAFLLKHVKRNKMGYVSIKLLTSFKKMKHMTKDWRTTAFALRHSELLEVNEEGKKVRRKVPVPESLLAQPSSRLLLVWNLQESSTERSARKNGIELALKTFSAYGTIGTIRILRPGKELPTEIKKYTYKYPELGSKECVLVEYEDLESAGRAYRELSKTAADGMKMILVGKGTKKKIRQEVEEKFSLKEIGALNKRVEQLQYYGEDSSAYSSSESEMSSSSSPMPVPRCCQSQVLSPYSQFLGVTMSPRFSPLSSPWSSPRSSPRTSYKSSSSHRLSPLLASEMWQSPDTSPEVSRRYVDYSSDGSNTTGSPWVQRRKLAAAWVSSFEGDSTQHVFTKRAISGEAVPPRVTRFPYGPDGTKGFHNSIGRGRFLLKN